MANLNTVLSAGNGATTLPTSTTSTSFGGATPVQLSIPQNWNFNAHPFGIRFTGTVTALNATSVVITPAIAIGTAATYASNAAFISTATGLSTNLAAQLTANFLLEAECLWDSTTGTINAVYTLFAGPTGALVGPVASTSVTTLTQGGAGSAGLNFVPFVKLSATSTNNLITISEFSIFEI